MKPQQQKRKKVSATVAQAVETSSERANEPECMSNSVVLRTILSNLSASDLMNCRRVNKLWFSEVNSVMCLSNIALKISAERFLQQIGQLTKLVPKMQLPFNGLSFRKFQCPKNNEDPGNAILDEFLQILPPIKHLRFNDSWDSKELIRRILESNVDHLEMLTFENASENLPTEILGAIFKLKRLRKISATTNQHGDRRNMCAIIGKCESIESVERIFFRNLEEVPGNRWHVIKSFALCIADESTNEYNWRPLDKYLQDVPETRRFTSLGIRSWTHCSLQTTQLILKLARSCRLTLTTLEVDLDAVQLRSVFNLCGECSNLRSLNIRGKAQSSDDLESELLGTFPEEVRRLRKMNLTAAQLRKLKMVPVRPALHHLTGLKNLTIVVFLEGCGIKLVDWDSKKDGISYCRRRDASKVLKAMSLGRMRSLWI